MLETLYINKPNILLFAGKRNLARLPSGEDRVWDSVQDSVFDSSFLPLSSQGFRAFYYPFSKIGSVANDLNETKIVL